MNKQVVTGIAVVISLIVVGVFFTFFGGQWFSVATQDQSMEPQQLVIQDIVVGEGAEATPGATVRVHYVGRLQNGQVFDSSYSRNMPFEFVLGAGDVIPGWDQGFNGMHVGGKRVLVVPPSLGYGPQGIGPIPPNSTLIFEVELLGVETPQGAEELQ